MQAIKHTVSLYYQAIKHTVSLYYQGLARKHAKLFCVQTKALKRLRNFIYACMHLTCHSGTSVEVKGRWPESFCFFYHVDPGLPGSNKHLYLLSHFTCPWWIFIWGIKHPLLTKQLRWTHKYLWLICTKRSLPPHCSLIAALLLQLYLQFRPLQTKDCC